MSELLLQQIFAQEAALLIQKAEERYTEVGSELARAFVSRYAKAKHPIPGLLRQVQVFESQVRPLLGQGRVAYVWVDALRFEMARELGEVLKGDFDLTLQPALATIPTITEIGMAPPNIFGCCEEHMNAPD